MEKSKKKIIQYEEAIRDEKSVKLSFILDANKRKEKQALERLISYMNYYGVNTREAVVALLSDTSEHIKHIKQNTENNIQNNNLVEEQEEQYNIDNVDNEDENEKQEENKERYNAIREKLLQQYS